MSEASGNGTNATGGDGEISPNWYVLVFGLEVMENTLVLAPGISLVPLPGPLDIFDMASAGAAGFREWSVIGEVANRCTAEIESAKDSDVTPGYDTLNRAWLASSLLVLRGFYKIIPLACSVYPWSTVAQRQKQIAPWFLEALKKRGMNRVEYSPNGDLRPFSGNLLEFHTRIFIPPSVRTDAPTEEDAAWCRSHFDRFNSLCAKSERFRFALEAAIDWRYSKDSRVAMSRLWAGIESLFGISAELVYRLSVYCASLLRPRGEERLAMYNRTKKLYSFRSKAVHGDKIASADLADGMYESFELLRELLLYCIEREAVPGEAEILKAVFE